MATEIKLTLTGYRVEEALPEESGNYLCCTDLCGDGRAYWLYAPYSAKHKLFNATDDTDASGAEKTHIPMDYWFEMPGTIAEIEKGRRS